MYTCSNVNLENSTAFLDSWVGKTLQADPVRVIDVGARDGFHPMFHKLGRLAHLLGFEPDTEAFAALQRDVEVSTPFSAVHIEPMALGAGGRQKLYTFSNPNNNSLLPPNLAMTSRYAMNMFELNGSIDVTTHRLDDVIFDETKDLSGFGEFIKLDTQGSEQLILEHAPRMLRRNTVGLVAEVWFCEVYKDQPLFHDLCGFLAQFGLRFYGFQSFFLRSGKRLDKRSHIGRERALYADAVFLRDPFDGTGEEVTQRQAALMMVFAIIAGYFDFALELADAFGGEDRDDLKAAIRSFARADVAVAAADLQRTTSAVAGSTENAMVEMGRFADRWRSTFDYTDVV